MKSFSLSKEALAMSGQYIASDRLANSLQTIGESYMRQFLGLWMAEGIPFAFREAPLIYEATRDWLSQRLEVNREDIRLVGSAKLGYSLSPVPKYGRSFGTHSDLDFAAVSQSLFNRLQRDVNQWQDDYDRGLAKPANQREASFWADNLRRFPKLLQRGYIDPKMIPATYPTSNVIMNATALLKSKLGVTPSAPSVERVGVRVYKTYEAFQAQMLVNLQATKESIVGTRQDLASNEVKRA